MSEGFAPVSSSSTLSRSLATANTPNNTSLGSWSPAAEEMCRGSAVRWIDQGGQDSEAELPALLSTIWELLATEVDPW